MLFRRRSRSRASSQVPAAETLPTMRAEVARLDARLADLLAETAALAKIRYLEWKVRKAEDRRTWLLHGVTMPRSPFDAEQDQLFGAMEVRIHQEEDEARNAVALRQTEEMLRLEYAEEDQARITLERERMEADKVIAETIARALQEDVAP